MTRRSSFGLATLVLGLAAVSPAAAQMQHRPAAPAVPAASASAAPHAPVTPVAARPSSKRTAADTASVVIEREVYSYGGSDRRDPFRSLMTTTELRPTSSELRLVAVAYDPTNAGSVAILRELTTKTQYRARVGTLIGRMRVVAIRPKAVVFTIEEMGFSRQETLGLNDSTAVRSR